MVISPFTVQNPAEHSGNVASSRPCSTSLTWGRLCSDASCHYSPTEFLSLLSHSLQGCSEKGFIWSRKPLILRFMTSGFTLPHLCAAAICCVFIQVTEHAQTPVRTEGLLPKSALLYWQVSGLHGNPNWEQHLKLILLINSLAFKRNKEAPYWRLCQSSSDISYQKNIF